MASPNHDDPHAPYRDLKLEQELWREEGRQRHNPQGLKQVDLLRAQYQRDLQDQAAAAQQRANAVAKEQQKQANAAIEADAREVGRSIYTDPYGNTRYSQSNEHWATEQAAQQQAQAEKQERRQTKGFEEAGIDFDIDPATGKRTPKKRDDGSFVYKPTIVNATSQGAQYRDETGTGWNVPLDRISWDENTRTHRFRNDEGKEHIVPGDKPLTTTDPGTGDIKFVGPDDSGAVTEQIVGKDERIARSVEFDKRIQSLNEERGVLSSQKALVDAEAEPFRATSTEKRKELRRHYGVAEESSSPLQDRYRIIGGQPHEVKLLGAKANIDEVTVPITDPVQAEEARKWVEIRDRIHAEFEAADKDLKSREALLREQDITLKRAALKQARLEQAKLQHLEAFDAAKSKGQIIPPPDFRRLDQDNPLAKAQARSILGTRDPQARETVTAAEVAIGEAVLGNIQSALQGLPEDQQDAARQGLSNSLAPFIDDDGKVEVGAFGQAAIGLIGKFGKLTGGSGPELAISSALSELTEQFAAQEMSGHLMKGLRGIEADLTTEEGRTKAIQATFPVDDPSRFSVVARTYMAAGKPATLVNIRDEAHGRNIATYHPDGGFLSLSPQSRQGTLQAVKLADNGIPVYFGNPGNRMSDEKIAERSHVGFKALIEGTTQQEIEDRLDDAGLSLGDIRADLQAGRISYQQARAFKKQFYKLDETDLAKASTTDGLTEWLSANEATRLMWEKAQSTNDPALKADVINRYWNDVHSASKYRDLAFDADALREARAKMLGELADKSFGQKTGTFLNELAKQSFGSVIGLADRMYREMVFPIAAGASAAGLKSIDDYVNSERARRSLSWDQTVQWGQEVDNFTRRFFTRWQDQPELAQALANGASQIEKGGIDSIADSDALKLRDAALQWYHDDKTFSPEKAIERGITADVFDVRKDPSLRAALASYSETGDPQYFANAFRLFSLDPAARKLEERVQRYTTRPRAATPDDLKKAAEGTFGLSLSDEKATQLHRLSTELQNDASGENVKAKLSAAASILGVQKIEDAGFILQHIGATVANDGDSWAAYIRTLEAAGLQDIGADAVSTVLPIGRGLKIARISAGAVAKAATKAVGKTAAGEFLSNSLKLARATERAVAGTFTSARDAVAATRGGKAWSSVKKALAPSAAKPLFEPTLGQPLGATKRAANQVYKSFQDVPLHVGIEGAEESIAEIGNPGATGTSVAEAFGAGAIYGGLGGPMVQAAMLPVQQMRDRRAAATTQRQRQDWANGLNDLATNIPGWKPVQADEYDLWEGLTNRDAIRTSFAAAKPLRDERESLISQILAETEDEGDTPVAQTDSSAGDIAVSIAPSDSTNDAAPSVAPVDVDTEPSEQPRPEAAFAPSKRGQLKARLSEVEKELATHEVAIITEIANANGALAAIREVADPKERTFLSAAVKAATGRTDFTPDEGALVRNNAAFQVSSPRVEGTLPTGAQRTQPGQVILTDEAAAQILAQRPEIGTLIANANATRLFHEQQQQEQEAAAAAATAAAPAVQAPQVSPQSTFPARAIWKNKSADAPVTITGFLGEKDGVRFYQSSDGTGIPESELTFESPAPKAAALNNAGTPKDATLAEQLPDDSPAPPAARHKILARVIAEAGASFPGIRDRLLAASTQNTSGAEYDPDADVVRLSADALVSETDGMTPRQAAQHVLAAIDEEVRHMAHMEAARRLYGASGDNRSFEVWRADYYGHVWTDDFTAEQRDAVMLAYGDSLNQAEDWRKAFEGLRMLSQSRAGGDSTETAKLWTWPGRVADRIIAHLRAALQFLKELATKGTLPDAIERDLKAIQALVEEWQKAPPAPIAERVLGQPAPLSVGKPATRTTPNNEMTLEGTATAVSLDQLVGSSDPRFPGKELQPHDRGTVHSAAQSVDLMRNLERNPDQWRRYHEGSTTDTGKLVIAPLFNGGKQATLPDGRPLYYVLSGNGRRNGIDALYRHGNPAKYESGLRPALAAEGSPSDLPQPVSVFIYTPPTVQDAVRVAEFSNRPAQLSQTSLERAERDAESISRSNLISLWDTGESADPLAASNRPFWQNFARAVGEPALINSDGRPSEAAIQRAENAMVAALLSDGGKGRRATLQQILERADTLGIRRQLSGIASRAPDLLKLRQSHPAYDIAPLVAESLATVVQFKEDSARGHVRSIEDALAQGDIFTAGPTQSIASFTRSLATATSARQVRDILDDYLTSARAIDTSTQDIFGDIPPTRDELLARAADSRPLSEDIAEFTSLVGAEAHPARVLAAIAPLLQRLDSRSKAAFRTALSYEQERLREGLPTALEYQRGFEGEDVLDQGAAAVQRWLDSVETDEASKKFQAALTAGRGRNIPAVLRAELEAMASGKPASPQVLAAASLHPQGTNRPSLVAQHRGAGNFRANWKITRTGRVLRSPQGQQFTVSAVDVKGGRITLQWEDGSTFTMPLKEAESRFMVELTPEELALEPIFVGRLHEFAKLKEHFDRQINAIASGLPDAVPLTTGLKGMPRALEKARGKVRALAASLTAKGIDPDLDAIRHQVVASMSDLLRASVVVDSIDQVLAARALVLRVFAPEAKLESSKSSGDIYRNEHVMIEVDDRFLRPTSAGYSDVQMKVEVAPGMFAEIQVHIPEMLVAKEGWFPALPERYRAEKLHVANGLGHKLFEEYRAIPGGNTHAANLEAEMSRLYSEAVSAHQARTGANFSANAALASTNSSQVSGPRVSAPSGQGIGESISSLPSSPQTNTLPSSTATGTPSSIQNLASGPNGLAVSLTPEITASSIGSQGESVRVTTANIASFAGEVDVSFLVGKGHQLGRFFEPGGTVVPLSRLVSPKNELHDPKFLAGLKSDPRQNAVTGLTNAFQGLGNKRKPLDVTRNADGTFTILDGNATAQALMLAGWKAVPVIFKTAPLPKASVVAPQLPLFTETALSGNSPIFGQREKRRTDFVEKLKYLQAQSRNEALPAAQRQVMKAATRKLAGDLSRGQGQLFAFDEVAGSKDAAVDALLKRLDDWQSKAKAKAKAKSNSISRNKGQGNSGKGNRAPDLFADQAVEPAPTINDTQTHDRLDGQSPEVPRLGESQRTPPALPGPPSAQGLSDSELPFGASLRGGESGGSSDGSGLAPLEIADSVGQSGESHTAAGSLVGQDERGADSDAGKPGAARPRVAGVGAGTRPRPPVGSPDRNHSISDDAVLAEGGAVTRVQNNIAALQLVRQLDHENRNPSPAEKAVLAKFVGWGALPQVFDDTKADAFANREHETRRQTASTYERYGPAYTHMVEDYRRQADAIENWHAKWSKHHEAVKQLLTPAEYEAAQASTINAHYTSPEVIRSMWSMVTKLGFKGGRILEPAGGVGHFYGLMPDAIADASRLSGVELDAISGRIFARLYPEADIQVTGFQDAELSDNSQDLIISNVPFADFAPYDASLEAQGAPKFSLHNYFFAKALQKLKPGGLVAFITTAHTLDSNIQQRQWLADRADLVGAIRLPNDAFRGNAGTDVVTDMVFLRKKDGSRVDAAQSWSSLAETTTSDGSPLRINEYFVAHPEMVFGRLADDGSMYGGRKEMTVHPMEGRSLSAALAEATLLLPEDVVSSPSDPASTDRASDVSRQTRGSKMGAISRLEDGSLAIAGTETQHEEILKPQHRKLAHDFMRLRDSLNALYQIESHEGSTDEQINEARRSLNAAYDRFKAEHGFIHKHGKLLDVDPDFYRTLGLEIEEKPTGLAGNLASALLRKKTYRKADVFTKRVLTPKTEPTRADTVKDAMSISLGWRGKLDTNFMASLTRHTVAEVETEMLRDGLVFRDPASGLLETSESYVAGNVRKKLRIAQQALQTNPAYQRNVSALEAAQPPDVEWKDIGYHAGSSWIPASIYRDFAAQLFGTQALQVLRHPAVGDLINERVAVEFKGVETPEMRQTYSTKRVSAVDLLESILNNQSPLVNDVVEEDGKKKIVFNAKATEEAKQVADRIRAAFKTWVEGSAETQEQLVRLYNETFNSHVVPTFDGQHLQLPWVAQGFELFPDKKNTVWRAIQQGNMLVAHGVGGGKTIIGTAIAMESKRLGLSKKPLIVVHNATLEQFATTISQMAPTARVLVARKKDLEGPKRKEFMARVASGDWDAVVMAHSTFNLLPDDPAYERKLVEDLMDQLDDALRQEGADPNVDHRKVRDDPTVKELAKAKQRLLERLKKLLDRKKDDVLTFQELGIDSLILDEAHLYKKLPFITRMTRIAGIDTGTSERGTALLVRSRFIQEKNHGRGVFTMTGTPVTNTLGESWNMVRLTRPDLLKEFAVTNFDAFVSNFASVQRSAELRANGQYKMVDRLSTLENLPEWNKFFRIAADVKMGTDMVVKGRPGIKGGAPELVTVERTPAVTALVGEIHRVLDWYDKLTGKEKRAHSHIPLVTYNAAKLAAIDARMVLPSAPDEPGSKVNAMVHRVAELYQRTTSYQGTQIIFADSFRPLRSQKLDLSAAELEQDDASDDTPVDGFNLYDEIKRKLVSKGIPAAEIASIQDVKNDAQRERLFEKVNDGEVRIILGSTQKLGTGVNVQQRMIAAHHLDVPWTPAELEQRDGRVYRQGNIHGEMGMDVEIYRYGMKDTLDAALWQKLETKERFIKQALSGRLNSRSVEDDTGLVSLAEQKAILTGPLGIRKFELEQKLRELETDYGVWKQRTYHARQEVNRLQSRERNARLTLPVLESRLSLLQTPWKNLEDSPMEVSLHGATFTDAREAREAIQALFDARQKYLGSIANPETAPKGREPLGAFTVNGVPLRLTVAGISEDLPNAANPDKRWKLNVAVEMADGYSLGTASSAGWVFRRLFDAPGVLGEQVGSAMATIRDASQQITAAQREAATEYTRADEATKVAAELASVMDALSGRLSSEDPTAAKAEELDASAPLGASSLQPWRTDARAWRNLNAARARGKLPPVLEQRLIDIEKRLGQSFLFDMESPALSRWSQEAAARSAAPWEDPVAIDQPELALASASIQPPKPVAPSLHEQALRSALEKAPELFRNVFADFLRKDTLEIIATRHKISTTAAQNIINQVNGRYLAAYRALSQQGPATAVTLSGPGKDLSELGSKLRGGRPDLALGSIPAVAAVDQTRNGAGLPNRITLDSLDQAARAMLVTEPENTRLMIRAWAENKGEFPPGYPVPAKLRNVLDEARATESLHGLMTMAAKLMVAEAALNGELTTAQQRTDTALLIMAYRELGTEQARALTARRDPYKSPAERHAAFLAEGMLAPDPESRATYRNANSASERKAIMEVWLKRVDVIKQTLKTEGIDVDRILADFRAEQEQRKPLPQPVQAVIEKADKATRTLHEVLQQGGTPAQAAAAAGLSMEQAKEKYQALKQRIRDAGVAAAQTVKDALLSAAPVQPDQYGLAGGLVDFAAAVGMFPDSIWDTPDARPAPTASSAKPRRRKTQPTTPKDQPGPPVRGGLVEAYEHRTLALHDPLTMRRIADAFAAARSTGLDKILEFWKASILSGPKTHAVNMASNASFQLYDQWVKRGGEALLNSLTGLGGKDAPTVSELPHMLAALLPALRLGVTNALRSFRMESAVFEAQALGLPRQDDFAGGKMDHHAPAIGGQLGRIIRIPFRLLSMADEFFKTVAGHVEAAAQAHRMAKAAGLAGAAYQSRVAKLLEPGSEAWEAAYAYAEKVTFQTPIGTGHKLTDLIFDRLANSLLNLKGKGGPLQYLDFMVPFVKTPTNIVKIGLEYSPLGAVLALADMMREAAAFQTNVHAHGRQAAAKMRGQIYHRARLLQDVVQQTIAWGLALYLKGLILPPDDEDDEAQDEQGLPFITGTSPWKSTHRGLRDLQFRTAPPQSVRIRRKWYSYARLEPFASALAGTIDALKADDWNAYGTVLLGQLKDKTFLAGLSDLANLIEDPERYGNQWAANIATGFIPNLIRQPLRETDPLLRDTKPSVSASGFFGELAQRIGYNVWSRGAPPKMDAWGRPVLKNNGDQFGSPLTDIPFRIFTPVSRSDAAASAGKLLPVDRYLLSWSLRSPGKGWAPEAMDRRLAKTIDGRTYHVQLSTAEYEAMSAQAGQAALMVLAGKSWDWRHPTLEGVEQIKDTYEKVTRLYRDLYQARHHADFAKQVAAPTP